VSLEESVQESLRETRAMRAELERLTVEVAVLRRSLPPLLVRPADAARALGVSLPTVRRRIKERRLPINEATGLVDLGSMHPPPDAEVLRRVMELKQRESSRRE
jgi:type II secretory pathway component PulM